MLNYKNISEKSTKSFKKPNETIKLKTNFIFGWFSNINKVLWFC
jgi:hypothetical protein